MVNTRMQKRIASHATRSYVSKYKLRLLTNADATQAKRAGARKARTHAGKWTRRADLEAHGATRMAHRATRMAHRATREAHRAAREAHHATREAAHNARRKEAASRDVVIKKTTEMNNVTMELCEILGHEFTIYSSNDVNAVNTSSFS